MMIMIVVQCFREKTIEIFVFTLILLLLVHYYCLPFFCYIQMQFVYFCFEGTSIKFTTNFLVRACTWNF